MAKEANYLSKQLRLLMTDLRAAGWAEVAILARTGAGGRPITIRKVANGSTKPAEGGNGAQVSTPGVDLVSMSASPTVADFRIRGVDRCR
jgi:hypothetical protein